MDRTATDASVFAAARKHAPPYKMRLGSIILFVAACSFTAYYIYEPIPEEIEERWKLMLTNSFFRSLSHLVREKKHTVPSPLISYLLYSPVRSSPLLAGYFEVGDNYRELKSPIEKRRLAAPP